MQFEITSHEQWTTFLTKVESQNSDNEEVGGLDVWHASLGNVTALVPPFLVKVVKEVTKTEAIPSRVLDEDFGKRCMHLHYMHVCVIVCVNDIFAVQLASSKIVQHQEANPVITKAALPH